MAGISKWHLLHWTMFAASDLVYMPLTVVELNRHPQVLAALVDRPLHWANITLVVVLIGVSALPWPWKRRIARFLLGDHGSDPIR
jgi:uncharacterized membrane protein (DUF2068 family)